jgi:hypothetical protein
MMQVFGSNTHALQHLNWGVELRLSGGGSITGVLAFDLLCFPTRLRLSSSSISAMYPKKAEKATKGDKVRQSLIIIMSSFRCRGGLSFSWAMQKMSSKSYQKLEANPSDARKRWCCVSQANRFAVF